MKRKLVFVLVVVLVAALASLTLRSVQGRLIEAWLPAFPQWTDSRATLAARARFTAGTSASQPAPTHTSPA